MGRKLQKHRFRHMVAAQRSAHGIGLGLLYLALLGISSSTSAQTITDTTKEAFERCQAISDKAEAAACVNQVATETWSLNVKVDKLDGSKQVAIGIMSPDKIATTGGRSSWAILFVKCAANKTELIVSWPKFLGAGPVPVKWRIDEEPVAQERWGVSTEGTMAYANNPIAMSKRMIGKKEFVANVESYSTAGTTVSFRLDGFEEALKPIRKACNW